MQFVRQREGEAMRLFECILLARYDRAVTAALFAPMDASLHSLAARKGLRYAFASSHLVAKGCIDPAPPSRWSSPLTPPGPFDPPRGDFSSSNTAHTARLALARTLGLLPEKRRKYLRSRLGIHLAPDD